MIENYIKIPFKNTGRDWDGCDCYGLVRLYYMEEYGKELPMLLSYSNSNDYKETASVLEENKIFLEAKQKDTPDIGDIVSMKFRGVPQHVGIYIGHNSVLHITHKKGTVVERLSMLKGHIDGYFEIDKS